MHHVRPEVLVSEPNGRSCLTQESTKGVGQERRLAEEGGTLTVTVPLEAHRNMQFSSAHCMYG
jgi:hypothetical protein